MKPSMNPQKKRTRLSFLIAQTNTLLTTYLSIIVFVLGSLYLFSLNTVAMKGYELTQEAFKSQEIASQIEAVESQIIALETKDFLTKKTEASFMVYNNKKDFLVYKESFTAQK